MLKAGTYSAVARSYEFGKTNKGLPQVVITFELVGEGEARGQTVPWFGIFHENTWKRTIESLRHCGFKGDDIKNLGKLNQIVDIVVEHNEWEGKTNARVSWVNRPGAGQVKLANPMSDGDLSDFAAKMRGRMGGIEETSGTTHGDGVSKVESNGSNASSAPAPEGMKDDLPF